MSSTRTSSYVEFTPSQRLCNNPLVYKKMLCIDSYQLIASVMTSPVASVIMNAAPAGHRLTVRTFSQGHSLPADDHFLLSQLGGRVGPYHLKSINPNLISIRPPLQTPALLTGKDERGATEEGALSWTDLKQMLSLQITKTMNLLYQQSKCQKHACVYV